MIHLNQASDVNHRKINRATQITGRYPTCFHFGRALD